MHLILVDTHLTEKQARDEDLWRGAQPTAHFCVSLGHSPGDGRAMACAAICNLQG